MIDFLLANALHIPLAAESVQMVATSPPYWGLRDYGTAQWVGNDLTCDHKERNARNDGNRQKTNRFAGNANREGHADMGTKQYRSTCAKCGAIRIDNQIGLEESPQEYIAKLVDVGRELWRGLGEDGTPWGNLWDYFF